jgi:hypothetical protein
MTPCLLGKKRAIAISPKPSLAHINQRMHCRPKPVVQASRKPTFNSG